MAVDANALTTLAKLQTYLGLAAGVNEGLLEDSIDAASVMIENTLGRVIKSRDLYEWHDSLGTEQIGVKTRPINHVKYVAYGVQNALTVTASSGSTDIIATVEVTPTHIRLFRVTSTGSTSTEQVQFTNHETVAELAAHINTVTGFVASSLGDYSAYQLHPRAGVDVLTTAAYLTAAWDLAADLRVDYEAGIISFVGDSWPSDHWTTEFPAGFRSVLVAYNGGHETVPYDVEQVCLEIAAGLYRDRTKDAGLQSESLGGYSYTLAAMTPGQMSRQSELIRSRLGARTRIR